MARLRVGTSGWNYRHWREIFYPRHLKQAQWLGHYATRFDTVEINSTFYRLPRPEYIERWYESVPEGFLFAVKGSRFLTHVKRLADSGESLDRFIDLIYGFGDKAGPLLWQLPPNMQRDEDRLAAFAGALPGGLRHAFEFRHQSWFTEKVMAILDNAGAALCLADHPERPQPLELTTDWTYIRFHYGAGADGSYSETQLGSWSERIKGYLESDMDVYAYFNNDWQGHAIDNATQLLAQSDSKSGAQS